MEWDVTIRPIIAKLYKAGIIRLTFMACNHIPGRAMAGPVVKGKRDLFIDLRVVQDEIAFFPPYSATFYKRIPDQIHS